VLLAGLAALPGVHAASCNPPSPPVGSGGAWFLAYQDWCRTCGGRPSADASPARCEPGPNWGGRAPTTGASTAGLSPGQALGRQIGTAAGGLLACALFGQCPGGAGPDAATSQQARLQNDAINEQQRALIAQAEREEAARLAAQQQRLQSALSGAAGGLQVRDLSADEPAPGDNATKQLGHALHLSQLAWRAETLEQAAELANRAFDAAAGGIVDGEAPGGTVVPADLARQFRDLREYYFKASSEASTGLATWVELEEQRAQVAALRADTQRKIAAHKDQPSELARLRALDAEAAVAEQRFSQEAERARGRAKAAQAPAAQSGQRMRDLLASSIAPAAAPAPAKRDPRLNEPAFYNGYMHGIQCFSPNAGPSCGALAGEPQKRCTELYQAGYRNGEKAKREMVDSAAAEGRRDRDAGRRHAAFTNPGAAGPCRITWIEAYTDGYQRSSPPVFR
jgi:hypothetical protein